LNWSALDIKSKIAYSTAVIAFALGWGLTIAGFVVGAGVISDSVLWVLGQALVYAASVFGVGMYVAGEVRGMKRSIQRFIHHPEDPYNEEVDEVIEGDEDNG
jgi:hypothetical protein